jgi:baculoviral IAP repeat-containing protein 6 (apollon)
MLLSFKGCDWLHEISISIRATREVPNVTNERIQRLAMLESNTLLKNLLKIAEDNNNSLMQNLAMDVLIWIVTIRLGRYRCPRNYASTDINAQQSLCVNIVEQNLSTLINKCVILNNRSTAHKCVKLVILTLQGAHNMVDQKQCSSFESALKNSISASIPEVVKTVHAGALRWFFTLISATSNNESQESISTDIMKLLIDILQEMSSRQNPLNSLLQSRFGLYGMPFESELFDIELPSFGRSNNTPYCNVFLPKPMASANGQQQNQFTDLKNFCSAGKFALLKIFYHKKKLILFYHLIS